MSDYLNNLVARTLSLAPVVQPRLSSLFEPVSAFGADAGRASFESETTRADLSPTRTNGRAEVQIETTERDVNPERRELREQSRGAAAQPHSFGPVALQHPAHVASQRVIPEPNPSHSAIREQGETSLIIRPQASISAGAANRQDSSNVVPAHSLHAKPPAAEGPQTISVTIGRVDVRAVFSPPLSTRVNRAQPRAPMSLDEYLKQRSGGRR
jgi:hypothetical protein